MFVSIFQKAGHYMDCYSSAIDAHMEEEDIVADQLKEYLYYGQSLQGLCSRHQMAQLEVEKAESHLSTQQYTKSRSLGQDGYLTKLWGKWTGTTESPDERQAKLETMDRNIDEAQVLVQTANTQLRFELRFCWTLVKREFIYFFLLLSQFSQRATNEVERFHQHKNANLQESLANYVILQMKLAKMVRSLFLFRRVFVYLERLGCLLMGQQAIKKDNKSGAKNLWKTKTLGLTTVFGMLQGLQTWKHVKEALEELPWEVIVGLFLSSVILSRLTNPTFSQLIIFLDRIIQKTQCCLGIFHEISLIS